jgi:hypothetical protein
MGSLYVRDGEWYVYAPTTDGPQPIGCGGEMCLWSSRDQGATWALKKQLTKNSDFNHSYARRPSHAQDPFYVYWADGNSDAFSQSRLYFSDSSGKVWRLPYDMTTAFATPEEVTISGDNQP